MKILLKFALSIFAIAFLTSCATTSETKYSKIEYEAGACFGSCPMFKLTINPDRTAVFEAEHFNFTKNVSKEEFSKPREGTFKGTIKKEDYDKLVVLLDSLNPKSLKDKYGERNITDLPTSYLRLNFKDGSSKTIEDYGKQGTPKLEEVYKFFEDLRFNQTWTKVK